MEKDEIDELLRAPNRAIERGQRDYALHLFLYNSPRAIPEETIAGSRKGGEITQP
jgi:hypothetical protein